MDRERLTITLRKDILKRLDNLIDGIKIRNRSHAIESIMEKALTKKVTRAVILAGGKGVKLRPLTYEIPKVLIPVAGKPLLEHQIDFLRESDIRQVFLAIGHLGEKIKNHLADGSRFGVNISYSEEKRPQGTAGALRALKSKLKGEAFLLLHGDILAEIDLRELFAFHFAERGLGTIALTTAADAADFGIVRLRGSRIVDFMEKPQKRQMLSLLVNSGIHVLQPEFFNHIPQKGMVMLEDIFPKLAREGKLAGFSFEGRWFDVSTPVRYEQAIKYWGKKDKIKRSGE